MKKPRSAYILYSMDKKVRQKAKSKLGDGVKTTDIIKEIAKNWKAISDKDKREQLEKLALNTVDVAGLAKYTLGQERKNLSDKQISQFVSTFKVFFSKKEMNS